jgi:hypothetical protein
LPHDGQTADQGHGACDFSNNPLIIGRINAAQAVKFVASYCNEFAEGFAAGFTAEFTDILRLISHRQLNFQTATYVQ